MDLIVITQCIVIMVFSLWKTYIGPIIAATLGFSFVGMLLPNLLAVVLSTYLSLRLNDYLLNHHQRPPRGYNKNLRKALSLWKKYGKWGAAMFAPVLISLPIYAFIAARLKAQHREIYFLLLLCSALWCSLFYVLALNGLLLLENVIELPAFITG